MRLFTLFFIGILLFCAVSDAISIPLGEAAPDFTLRSLDGESVSMSGQKGHTVVLIYWRTEHQRSLLALTDAVDDLESMKKKDVKLFSVIAGGDDPEKAKMLLAEKGLGLPVLIDTDRELYSAYGIRVYPTTIIIDGEGHIVKDIPSHPLTYKKLLRGYIKMALGEIDESGLQEMIDTHTEKKDDSTLEADRLYNLAMKFTESGLMDMAVTSARKSIEAKSDKAESRILLGFLLLEMKEVDEALDNFKKAVELDAHSKEAQTGLGGAYVLKGDADKAIEILEPASKANPYPEMTYYELGKAYELKGDKEQSIKMYKKAIEKIVHKMILPSSVAKCQQ